MLAISEATLSACQRGDAAAFRTLILAYQQAVLSLCVAMAGDDGEDIAQETFVRVYAAIHRFDLGGSATLRAWILVIARRLCHDHARKLRHQPRADPGVVERAAADERHGPQCELVRSRVAAGVATAIRQLPVEQRVVLALREWEGLDYEEIAAIEAIPIGTVRSRLARARESLRRILTAAGMAAREETHAVTR